MRSVTRGSRHRALAALALVLGTMAGAAPAAVGPSAAAAEFPSYDSRYHSYREMVAAIKAVEAAHPDIVDVFSMGRSYEGRDIWAAKISDNVTVDENEPEILFDSLHHAREHMTLEQTLYVLRQLADGWRTDETVTSIIRYREVWIVFALNPDGAEYDLTGDPDGPRGPYRAWRKNRQPNAGSAHVGTDLNRNYDYRWACCGGSSGDPSSITYRGTEPWSTPETRVLRDFVNSRVVNGLQQIRSHITFHTNGELILFPYGYTYTDIPPDMTRDDYRAFVAFARGQAARNGYAAQQSSALYVTDGDQIDWMYGRHRIFSFTWELYPPEQGTVWGDHYPADEQIAPQTARNRTALLYFMLYGDCAWRTLGTSYRTTHCGPFNDDLEISRYWRRDPDGTDTATTGAWQRGDPVATSLSGRPKQLGTATSGRYLMVTGAALGRTTSANDVDGGTSTVRSVPIQLPPAPGDLTFRWFFGTHYASTSEDRLRAWVEGPDGSRTAVFQKAGAAGGVDAVWTTARVDLSRWAGKKVRMWFSVTDGGADSLVEAGFDDVRIERS